MQQLLNVMRTWISSGFEAQGLLPSRSGHTTDSWIAARFDVLGRPVEVTELLVAKTNLAMDTEDHNRLIRCLGLIHTIGSQAAWDVTIKAFGYLKEHPEHLSVTDAETIALTALLGIEHTESTLGHRHKQNLEFWLELMSNEQHALVGFAGLRNHHPPLAFHKLDVLLGLLKSNPGVRVRQTLIYLRRYAAAHEVDQLKELSAFFKQKPELDDSQRALLDEVFGAELIAQAADHN